MTYYIKIKEIVAMARLTDCERKKRLVRHQFDFENLMCGRKGNDLKIVCTKKSRKGNSSNRYRS